MPDLAAAPAVLPEKKVDAAAVAGSESVTPPVAAPPPAKAPESATAPKAAAKAPEKYELKMPDGSLLDAGAIERTATYAKERGLSNEDAQAVLERDHATIMSYADAQKAMVSEKLAAWVEDVKADKELGGDNFGKSVELAKRVVERFGTDAFKKALNESGLGNHPELVRVFVRIGRSMAEDTLVVPRSTSGTKRSLEEVFYGGTKEKSE